MFKKIMPIPENYKERFGDKDWSIPEGSYFCDDVCYEDGSPVLIGDGTVIKVGKRKFVKLVLEP